MRKVSDIINRKGNNVLSVLPETSVINALELMAEKNVGSLVVMVDNRFLGILTERDYSRKVILKGRLSSETTVEEIMTTEFPPVSLTDTVEKCMQLMSAKHIRYLPVMNMDQLIGIISISDVVTETILNQEDTIAELKNYIQS